MFISENLFTSAPASAGRLSRETRVYALLDEKGIEYSGLDHDEADTMEKCLELESKLGAKICKNLFLCNRQETEFYLLMMPGDKPFKTKYLSAQINSSRLSFASAENMEKYLDILPGAVSFFGLMNNKEKNVRLLVDKDLLSCEYLGCHPCVCTSVLKIRTADLFDVLAPSFGVTPETVELPDVIE